MKLFIKYISVLVVILLSGRSFTYAHTSPEYQPAASSVKTYKVSVQGDVDIIPQNELVTVGVQKPNDQVQVLLFENEENDELTSFKKQLGSGQYCLSSLFARASGRFFISDKASMPYVRVFSELASRKYLFIRVFRI